MPEIPQQPKSQSSGPRPEKRLPEMGLDHFRKLVKSHFSINCEPGDTPYKVRFLSAPYVEADPSCRSLTVLAHDRGKGTELRLSPLNIRHILAKFEITEDRFHEAYQLSANKVEPISPNPPAKKAS
jgi:hypothetical protein